MKKRFMMFFLLLVFVLVGCTDNPTVEIKKDDEEKTTPIVVLLNQKNELTVGETYKIDCNILDGTAVSTTFISSNNNIASVASDGTVTAKAEGAVQITIFVLLEGEDGATLEKIVDLTIKPQPFYAITYNLEGGTLEEGAVTTYETGKEVTLPTCTKEGYKFTGWVDSNSKKIDKITSSMKSDLALKATWEKLPTPIEFSINNIGAKGIGCYETLQIEYGFYPENAYPTNVKFSSSDDRIFTVTEGGFIEGLTVGIANLIYTVEGNHDLDGMMQVKVYRSGNLIVSYDSNSYVTIGQTIQLNAEYVKLDESKVGVEWSSLNQDIATVDANGIVTGVKEGNAKIHAKVKGFNEAFDFDVTVVSSTISEGLKLVLDSHESNVFVRYNLGIGAGTPVYYMDIIGSVSDIAYTETLTLNTKYEAQQAKLSTNHGGVKTSTEFICVHYTGNMSKGANANANASYFASGGGGTSIHYTTGNDGVFSILADNLVGYHAGDGHDNDDFYWRATGVKVAADDPETPVWGISKNSKFTINGKETNQNIPTGADNKSWTKNVTSDYYTYNKKQIKAINDMGLAYKIVNGEYYMGTTWWCYTQVSSGKICNKGGNMNSIGIESCVDKGSDLWETWHKTAQLVAKLMVDNNLDLTRVVGHHFYSGKNCPQPMLENDMELWYVFKDLVAAEYKRITTCKDYTYKFEIVSGSTNTNVRATQEEKTKLITYKVTITKGGKSETVTLSSLMAGTNTK